LAKGAVGVVPLMGDPGMNPPAMPPMGDHSGMPPMGDPNQFSAAEKQQWATNCRGSRQIDCTLPAWVPPGYTLSIQDRRAGELIRCEPSLGCDPTSNHGSCGSPSKWSSAGGGSECMTPGEGLLECRRKANRLSLQNKFTTKQSVAGWSKCG
jgi:hypothetical protein